MQLLQSQCIKSWILKAQWLPGLFLINVKQRLLTIVLNSMSMNLQTLRLAIRTNFERNVETGTLCSTFQEVLLVAERRHSGDDPLRLKQLPMSFGMLKECKIINFMVVTENVWLTCGKLTLSV